MKALTFSISALGICLFLASSNACLAETRALPKLPLTKAGSDSGHSKIWLEEKLSLANSLIEKNTSNPKLFAARAQLYYELKNYDKAISDISKAISLDPKVQEYFHLRAVSQWGKMDNKQAISDMTRAIDIGPTRADLYYERGTIFLLMKQYASAGEDAGKSLKLRPNDYATLVLMGASEHNQDRLHPALDWYSKAISVNPKNGETYVLRSGVYKLLGDNANAQKDHDTARRLGSNL